ncbi:hypothetical protein H6G45_13295 [Synechocystis sp. FACHB-383]|nr:hypothetical protein [Synechocystis sp. FACHB-383]MBD2654439.1 hypothetical protein [Synechocystis sp. FACHB-383]
MAGASWPSRWAQRLFWLISALSGTLEIEAETERLKHETEQIRKDNERLAVLESKIDTLFCKHDINLPPARTPEQP